MSDTVLERVIADRYELLDVIGRGGSSTVYRARDRSLQQIVAVKVMPLSGAAEEDRQPRRETAILPVLQHETLVSVLDQILDEDAAYIVMELMPDGSLRDRMRDGSIQPADVAAIGMDVAAALHHIHARGIIHRDVKPANILLHQAAGTRAKLTDFGIAKLLDSGTTTTGLVGTAYYLSPEQANGSDVGPASDIYSLGLTLLEALTGRVAFPGTVAESISARVLRDPGIPAGLPNVWRSLLGCMTARDPMQRPTADDVSRRLGALVDGEPIADTAQLTIITMPLTEEPRRRSPRSGRMRRRLRTHRARLGMVVAAATLGLAAASTLAAAAPAFGPGAAQAAAVGGPSPSPSATTVHPGAEPSMPTARKSGASGVSAAATAAARQEAVSPPGRHRAVGHGAGQAKGATAGKGKKTGQHRKHPGG